MITVINWKKQYLWLLIFLVASMFLASCSKRDSQPTVKIKQEVEIDNEVDEIEDPSDSSMELTFAILSNASAKETYRTHYNFIRFFEEQIGVKVDIIQKNTYGEILELFKSDSADVGIVCGYLSVLGDEQGVMEKVAMPVVNGNKQYSSYIITRKDEDITTIQDFQGKKFAFSNPYSFAGYLVPKYLVEREGYDFDYFFEKIYFTYSHDHSVLSVVNGLVDGAAIYSTTYDKLLKNDDSALEEIKIVMESALIGNHPIVVNPYLNSELKGQIKEIFLNMHESEEGKVVLDEVNYDYFIPIEEDLYSPVQLMLEEMDVLE